MTHPARGAIPCTVGILTFNSEAFLERCLQGLSDFSEIVIADSGSTDATLTIAEKYGCTIISQSNPGHPITDFALERNRMVDAASNDWFLSLDSDELITPALVEDIRNVTETDGSGTYIYRVPYRIVSEDLQTVYASFKKYYQHRFFNKKTGARYTRKVHERIVFDEKKWKQGTLTGCWHVPLDIQLDFSIYKQKVDHRINIMVKERPSKHVWQYLRRIIIEPARNIAKQLIKFVWLRTHYPAKELTPARYEAYKLYSQFVFIKEETRHYLYTFRPMAKRAVYAMAYFVRSVGQLFNRNPEVTVLMYHEIDTSGSKLAVTPETLEKQLLYLQKNCTVVSLDTICDYVRGITPMHGKAVAVTFDDAYRDILTTVAPLLEKYQIPATVFVPSDTAVQTNKTNTPRLSLDEIKTLSKSAYLTFESHGTSHRAFPTLTNEELTTELLDSKHTLEHALDTTIAYVAYPYGARDRRTEQAVAEAGYVAAFSITEGTIAPGDNMYCIKRVQVDNSTTLRLFAWRLTRAVDIHRWTIDRLRAML